ncbi:MAG: NAD-dependent deacylase [Candidatus Krumholzibacteriota bacterium]|nr:NAD-dependent deacylase [Candidatus Krumholzibacteriota bacterium]
MFKMMKKAAEMIMNAGRVTAFTGAGISVESGIPPFRGEGGLWNKYNPVLLDINHFRMNPFESWTLIKEIFYDFFGEAAPNRAHYGLAEMEKIGLLGAIITQNIDNLHQVGGSRNIFEFHGNSRKLVCVACGEKYSVDQVSLNELPPECLSCGGVLKPDFIFFGEQIPEPARTNSFREADISDLFILIGTTGEVMPACAIPYIAKENGAGIIEINTNKSSYTDSITDIFFQGKASEMTASLLEELRKNL